MCILLAGEVGGGLGEGWGRVMVGYGWGSAGGGVG